MGFGGFLKQSTAVDVLIGPFVDSTDGDTEEAALTINRADVLLSKNGQGAVQKTDVTAAASDADGFYNCELDATDTDTVGQLVLYVHVAGALAVRHDYQIVEEEVYVDFFAASAVGYLKPTVAGRDFDVSAGGEGGVDWANVGSPTTAVDLSATDIQLVDTATAVTNDVGITAAAVDLVWDEVLTGATHNVTNSSGKRLRQASDANQPLDEGTAQGGAAGSITLATTADAVNDDIYEDAFVSILSGTGAGQVRFITSYTASSRVALVHEDWIVTPTSDSVYDVHGSAAADVHAIADSNTAALNLLADYDGTGYAKANSTIGTTTTNTDMVGTDSALLASSAPTNFGDLSIVVTTGLVDITQAAADKVWSTAARALTDKAGFSIAVGGVIDGALAAAELLNIADACLDRRLDLGTDTGGDTTTSRTWRDALRVLRNRADNVAGTLTVYEEDDTTAAFTAALSTTAGNPISQVNPT